MSAGMATRRTAHWLAAAMLAAMLISFRPFSPMGGGAGDVVNQLGFGLIGALAIGSLLLLADRRVLGAAVSPGWGVMAALMLLSILASPTPESAARAVALTFIGMIAATAVIALPRDGDGFALVFAAATGAVLSLSYAGLVLVPDLATHGADALEPANSYLWRGVFAHKNIAGPVMACFVFMAIYLCRRGWLATGVAIGSASLLFLAQTGSKTSLALLPLAVLPVIAVRLFGSRMLGSLLAGFIQLVFLLLTIGTVLFQPLRNLVSVLPFDTTFTGRTAIWTFALDRLRERPWTGYGFESFWSTPLVMEAANPYYLDWDVRGIVHGHNGYLDVAVTMGLPALVCAVLVIGVLPLVDYARTRLNRDNGLLADCFLMTLVFCNCNAVLESFYFRRVDPVWLCLLVAIFGLRRLVRRSLSCSPGRG